MNTFWMVVGSGTPNHRHTSPASARQEAERLARLNPGAEFVVLQAVAQVVKTELAWTKYEIDNDIPF